MRTYFINRFYRPAEPATAQLLADLAESLAAQGEAVSVITGHPQEGLAPQETQAGVEIIRVGAPMGRGQNLGRRALDFARLHFAVPPLLARRLRPGDTVVALTDPPLLAARVTPVAHRHRARVVHWVHDIYPEIVAAVRPSPLAHAFNGLLKPLRNRAWRQADACVTLGEDMAAELRKGGVAPARVRVIPNWAPQGVTLPAPETVADQRARWGLTGRFVVGYSGNLGRVHDLGGLIGVAEKLRDEPAIVFVFIGQGAAFAGLQHEAEKRGLASIRFFPPAARRDLSATLAVPDVHLVSVREGCESLVFPSKLAGIAAVGRPVALLGAPGSELARTIDNAGMGRVFRPHDVDGIAGYFRLLAKDPALVRDAGGAAARFHAAQGGADRALEQWRTLLRGLTVSDASR